MPPHIKRGVANAAIVLAALFFLVIGLGNHLYLVSARQLVEAGAQADGVVTERVGRRNSGYFNFHYRFSVSGREFTGLKRPAPYRMRDELEPGRPIRVWYDPADPSKNTTQAELADLESSANRIIFPAVSLALIAWLVRRVRSRGPK